MSWRLTIVTVLALLTPVSGSVSTPKHIALPSAPSDAGAPLREAGAPLREAGAPLREVYPLETWSSARDARALAADAVFVWVATGGGVDRYRHDGGGARHFGTADGLDTLDVRTVEIAGNAVVARTGTSRCSMTESSFVCRSEKAPPPPVSSFSSFRGHPVAARLRVGTREWVATRGGGAFFVPTSDATQAIALADTTNDPASFIQTAATFGGALWLGTFDDGLYRVPLDATGKPTGPLAQTATRVKSPARLVNRLVATSGKDAALYVGASEGLFVTRDGLLFSRVEAISPRPMTGLSFGAKHLWATTTEALYRLAPTGLGPVERSFVRPGGSHAIQAVSVDEQGTAWLATEDRGVVRVDLDGTVRTHDRLAGLPSSWFVAVETDGNGGAIGTTLRHGTVRLAADGSWSKVDWTPSPWGLAVARYGARICVGTQGGVACRAGNDVPTSLALLPDPRVHLVLPLGSGLLVGTEAGAAIYTL